MLLILVFIVNLLRCWVKHSRANITLFGKRVPQWRIYSVGPAMVRRIGSGHRGPLR